MKGNFRIVFIFGYTLAMVVQGIVFHKTIDWWIFQLVVLAAIQFVWWLVLIIKAKP